MDYKARFFDPYTNRFIQPDTIIPNPANPQSLNRYSYVYNSPINFNDPTGHDPWWCTGGNCVADHYGRSPAEGITPEHSNWLYTLRDEALRVSSRVAEGEIDDVEALALITEFAAPRYQRTANIFGRQVVVSEDKENFVRDLGIVLGGNINNPINEGNQQVLEIVRSGRTPTMRELKNAYSIEFTGPNDENSPLSRYYTGFGAFGTEGFGSDYYEQGGNQARHFAGGLAAAGHSPIAEQFALWREDRDSADYRLHRQAFRLYHSDTPINRWGNWIRENLAQ